jgi:hypothetical protein
MTTKPNLWLSNLMTKPSIAVQDSSRPPSRDTRIFSRNRRPVQPMAWTVIRDHLPRVKSRRRSGRKHRNTKLRKGPTSPIQVRVNNLWIGRQQSSPRFILDRPAPHLALQQEYMFFKLITAFMHGIYTGAINIRHSSALLAHYGRLDITYDHCVKALIDVLRDEGMYKDNGTQVAEVIIQAITEVSQVFFLSKRCLKLMHALVIQHVP